MIPQILFHLSHDDFDHFAEKIVPHGISVLDTESAVRKNLETGSIIEELVSGALIFQGARFTYERKKTIFDPDFRRDLVIQNSPSVRSFLDGCLTLVTVDSDPEVLSALVSILQLIFPNPPAEPAPMEVVHRSARYRLFMRLGCSAFLVLIALICLLTFYGFHAFLQNR